MPKLSPLHRLAREHETKRGKERLSPTGDLKNEIHPLFARERFDSDINYHALIPSLRLVTRLLDTPQMHFYFYVIFYGEERDLGFQDREDRDMREVRSEKRVHTLTDEDVAHVKNKLNGLAEMLSIGVSGDLPENVRACCGPVRDVDREGKYWRRKTARSARVYGLPGHHSKIQISREWYETVLELENQNVRHCPTRALHTHFINSTVVLHELAHAAHGAAFPGTGPERFFEDCAVNEAGSQIEVCMFGSGFSHDDDLYRIYQREWPNKSVVERYDQSVAHRDPIVTCRDYQALPKHGRNWVTPMYYVESLFYEWFWNEMGRTIGARALITEPLAQMIRKAVRGTAHTRTPVPQCVADLFVHAAELRGAVLHPSDQQQTLPNPR